jgi:transposase
MEAREQRGIELAKSRQLKKKGDTWLVPSQVGATIYKVSITAEAESCTCPDYETRQMPCKHIYAAAYVMMREINPDGTETVTETLTVTQRKTYPQNWKQYNAAQTSEQDRFQELLRDLCSGLPASENKNGRPPVPLADAVFSVTFKVYSTVSGRRFMSDLREAHKRGYIARVPHYNSIFNYLEKESLTPILRELVQKSSLPLRAIETDFAVDSSGFTTSRFIRWYDKKYGRVREKHDWVKAHLTTGVKTNVVTDIQIADKDANDSPFMAPLVETTAKNFKINEVSGDKAYASVKNFQTVALYGGTPYVPFRIDHSGRKGGLWEKLFYFFMYERDKFLEHYHKRSNAESTFSMMKRKFGDSLRSRTDAAMVNEALCKVLCHNLVVLIHEMHELGIEPTFWANAEVIGQG